MWIKILFSLLRICLLCCCMDLFIVSYFSECLRTFSDTCKSKFIKRTQKEIVDEYQLGKEKVDKQMGAQKDNYSLGGGTLTLARIHWPKPRIFLFYLVTFSEIWHQKVSWIYTWMSHLSVSELCQNKVNLERTSTLKTGSWDTAMEDDYSSLGDTMILCFTSLLVSFFCLCPQQQLFLRSPLGLCLEQCPAVDDPPHFQYPTQGGKGVSLCPVYSRLSRSMLTKHFSWFVLRSVGSLLER